jgi:AcrR family transcriptional regulator
MSAPGDPEETRARIIEAAMSLFAERGFDGASTRELGERAGCNIATLNYHFGSKAGVYEAAVDEVYRRLRRRVDEALAGGIGDARSPRAIVLRLVPRLYDAVRGEKLGVRLVLREVIDQGRLPARLESTHVLGGLAAADELVRGLIGQDGPRVRSALVAASFLLGRYVMHDEDALARSFGVATAAEAHALAQSTLGAALSAWLPS